MLLKHHLHIAGELVEQLEAPPASPQDGLPSPANGRSARGAVSDDQLLDTVLSRANPRLRDLAAQIIQRVAALEDVSEPIPERPRNQKPPKYFRFTRGRKTFAYVHVRRDDLKIHLAISPSAVSDVYGIRARQVQPGNPLQVSFYASREGDIEPAMQAIQRAHELAIETVPS